MHFWTCPQCGANLDSGESCDCENKKETVPTPRKQPQTKVIKPSLSALKQDVKERRCANG